VGENSGPDVTETTETNTNMKSETDYRTKLRAVFLAAIMVTSVVGMSVAFTGTVAATTDPADVQYDPTRPYAGQDVMATNDTGIVANNQYDLYRVDSEENDRVESASFIEELEAEDIDGTDTVVIETDDLEAGNYFLRHADGDLLPRRPNMEDTFEVRIQSLDVVFEDDVVTSSGDDAVTELEIDSRRGTYSVNVSADSDLETEELLSILVNNESLESIHLDDDVRSNVTFGSDNTPELFTDAGAADGDFFDAFAAAATALDDDGDLNAAFTDNIETANDIRGSTDFFDDLGSLNPFFAFAYSEDEDDADEQVVLFEIRDTDADVDFTDIDEGDYTFDFSVTDTEADASADITVRDEDIDGAFSQGVYQQAAGDIAEFTIELEDTDEAWIQIGDEDAGYLDVIYVVDDDETGEVTFEMNTRLAGTTASTDEVYNSEDDDIVFSAVHDYTQGGNYADPGVTFWDDNDEAFDSSSEADSFTAYLEELGLIDNDDDSPLSQLTRPLQPADYELTASEDGVFIADDGESEADNELDSALLELETPQLGDVTTHVAPSEDANEDDSLDDLLDVVTEREDIALEDRLVVQVEATGLYGAIAATAGFDVFEDGTTADVFGDADDPQVIGTGSGINNIAGEGIELTIEADERSGNQDPLEINLGNDNADEIFVLFDRENGQFFLIVDTDADDAFNNGEPRDGESFTATLEYITDDSDRYRFNRDDGDVQGPFDGAASSTRSASDATNRDDAYPYLAAGSGVSTSAEFTFENRHVTFENLNADDEIQAENIDDSEISGTTNIAPGSPGEIRVSSTDASTSFRVGQSVDIDEDGAVSAAFDFSGQEVGDLFNTRFRVSGSNVDTVDSVIVAEGDLGVEDPVEDDADDDVVEDDDDDVVEDDDDVVDDDDDVEEPTDDETPGFGVLVALLAILGAALLATRRQN